MKVLRRDILKAGIALAGVAGLAGCKKVVSRINDRIASELTDRMGGGIPRQMTVCSTAGIDADFHLLSRATYGASPGDLDSIKKMGRAAWLAEQLEPDRIDDSLGRIRTRRFESVHMRAGDCYDVKREVLRKDMTRHTLLKAVYSQRQLLEVMVGFWSDHLNISMEKGDCIYLKPSDDRSVIRKHALGNFRDLIRASALSPAMLVYLDGKDNKKAKPDDAPNENYARELLELHTLGVDGGYTQKDVLEAARCLTGWRMHTKWKKGNVFFEKGWHDDGEKIVLGRTIAAGGGADDVERLIDIVCNHPSTARHIAHKLVRRFVADDPPESLVLSAAHKFSNTGGDIKSVIELILTSDEFYTYRGNRFKRPFRFVVSALRATGARTFARQGLIEYLGRMGQAPFQHPTPDGYPEETLPWLGTLLWRWNFALALSNNDVPSVKVPFRRLLMSTGSIDADSVDSTRLASYFLGRAPTPGELESLRQFASRADGRAGSELIGLIIAAPAFQMY